MKIVQQDHLNFLLTNFIPRRMATTGMGWLSRSENPLVRGVSMRIWRFFTDIDLGDAQNTHFRSMHDCFTRRLKDGARLIEPDPAILTSPCDGIVGACGTIEGDTVLQVKDMPYLIEELFGDAEQSVSFRDGQYVTLRLTSAMYHRFHAPHDCRVTGVTHIFGDTWNVNPITLKRVRRLFCRNERAIIRMSLPRTGHPVSLVAVAAILVAGIKLQFLDLSSKSRRAIRSDYRCDATLNKGSEMGLFEHGSTILVFAPRGFTLCDGIEEGSVVRMGQGLMRLPSSSS